MTVAVQSQAFNSQVTRNAAWYSSVSFSVSDTIYDQGVNNFTVDSSGAGGAKVASYTIYEVTANQSGRQLRVENGQLQLEDWNDNDFNDLTVTGGVGQFWQENGKIYYAIGGRNALPELVKIKSSQSLAFIDTDSLDVLLMDVFSKYGDEQHRYVKSQIDEIKGKTQLIRDANDIYASLQGKSDASTNYDLSSPTMARFVETHLKLNSDGTQSEAYKAYMANPRAVNGNNVQVIAKAIEGHIDQISSNNQMALTRLKSAQDKMDQGWNLFMSMLSKHLDNLGDILRKF
jgi:hypothetical protein